MKLLKMLGCIAVALMLMGILYRPGVRVIVHGSALPGVYDPAIAARCANRARAAAEEICREEAMGDYKLIPVLTARYAPVQELQLTRVLLEAYDGVERVYTIRADGEPIGAVATVTEAYRLHLRYPDLHITAAPTYTCTEAESVTAVMARLEGERES